MHRWTTRSLATLALAVVLALGLAFAAGAQDNLVKRGADIGDSPAVDLAVALESISSYADRTVTVEGTVNRVCQMKGCWMELVPSGADRGIRVTFKDYAFFVPTDSRGAAARLEGMFEEHNWSKADADHLIAEGVALTRNPDGTATEVSFVAQAVELRR